MSHAIEAALVRGLSSAVRRMPWRRSLDVGARLGDVVRMAGIRRRVAEDNLARCVPGWSAEERAAILREHYREVGRIAVEYARLPELVQAPEGEVIAERHGLEHLYELRDQGRGAIFVTGHFGNFELLGADTSRRHPVTLVVKPLANAEVDAWVSEQRRRAGISVIAMRDVRRIVEAVRAGRWVAMLADQDAGRRGLFVPFMGRPASTPAGPARLAVAARAPIVMGRIVRGADGRHRVTFEPPLEANASGDETMAVHDLTRRHVARLEAWIRHDPWNWLWLHRRWKAVPEQASTPAAAAAVAT